MGLVEFWPRFADAVRLDGVDILEELGRCEPNVVVGAYEHEMDNFSVIGCGQTDPGHGLNRLIVDLGLRWSEVPDCQFIVGQFIVKIPAALSNSFIKQLQFGGYLGVRINEFVEHHIG